MRNYEKALDKIHRKLAKELVLGERDSIPIKNPPPHRGDSHRAEGLRFEVGLVIPCRNHLHPPQSGQQHAESTQDQHRDRPQLGIIFLELVENQHQAEMEWWSGGVME